MINGKNEDVTVVARQDERPRSCSGAFVMSPTKDGERRLSLCVGLTIRRRTDSGLRTRPVKFFHETSIKPPFNQPRHERPCSGGSRSTRYHAVQYKRPKKCRCADRYQLKSAISP